MKKLFILLLFVNMWASNTLLLDYKMDEFTWDNNTSTYEINNSGSLGSDYNATALNDANVTPDGKLCNGGDINSSQNENEAILAKTDYALPSTYTVNVWINFPLNSQGHKIFTSGPWWDINRYEYFNIMDRKGSNKDAIYFEVENYDVYKLVVSDDNGDDGYDFNFQGKRGWHMLTFVVSDSNTTFYWDGQATHTFSTHPDKGNLGLLFNSDYGANNDDEPNGQSIGSTVDEFELYEGDLSSSDISNIYNNENNGKNGDGSTRICPSSQTSKTYTFDARDVFRDYNDTNISTEIVNKDFNLTIASYDENKSNLQDFNGTVCVQVIDDNDNNLTPWKKMTDFLNDVNESNWTDINISSATKKAKVTIQWKQNSDENCPLSDEDNETNSSDEFALRPYKFEIINNNTKIISGKEFNLTLEALDYKGNPTKDYNESVYIDGNSADLEYNISKSGCFDGNLTKVSDANFTNGEVNITLKYNEVGDLNLTLKEVNESEFAKIDDNDTNEDVRFIEENKTIITIIPHHFELNASVRDYDNNFTYLDNDLVIHSLIDLNITAENEQNETTKNYNKECYAKNIDVNLTPDIYRHNETLTKDVLYKILYVDSNSSIYKYKDINFSVGESNFTTDHNGSVRLHIYVNFEKNISSPEDPFEYNISNAEVNDSDTNLTYFNLDGNSTLYYSNLLLFDEDSNESNFTTRNEYFIIYDDNESDNKLPSNNELLPNWYLNLYHKSIDGNISNSNIIISTDYNASHTISKNDLNVSINTIQNGTMIFDVNRSNNAINFAVIHLLEPNLKWLWYSKFSNEYNISSDSTCLNHFCFGVTWNTSNGSNQAIMSGEINGTKANIVNTNTRKRGVKIFR